VSIAFKFAFAMTYGEVGRHRDHRSGGSHVRQDIEIFTDTFQGKLAEFAVANLLLKQVGYQPPDTSKYGLGTWEDADFVIGTNRIAVKSTKYFGNLLLLESNDWDEDGRYKPSLEGRKNYSHIVLVRLKPDVNKVVKLLNKKMSASEEMELLEGFLKEKWEYDVPGWINSNDLSFAISNNIRIPKGSTLNGTTVMDADNYYFQTGDLRPVESFLESLLPD